MYLFTCILTCLLIYLLVCFLSSFLPSLLEVLMEWFHASCLLNNSYIFFCSSTKDTFSLVLYICLCLTRLLTYLLTCLRPFLLIYLLRRRRLTHAFSGTSSQPSTSFLLMHLSEESAIYPLPHAWVHRSPWLACIPVIDRLATVMASFLFRQHGQFCSVGLPALESDHYTSKGCTTLQSANQYPDHLSIL